MNINRLRAQFFGVENICDHFNRWTKSYSWKTKCAFHQDRSQYWILELCPLDLDCTTLIMFLH